MDEFEFNMCVGAPTRKMALTVGPVIAKKPCCSLLLVVVAITDERGRAVTRYIHQVVVN